MADQTNGPELVRGMFMAGDHICSWELDEDCRLLFCNAEKPQLYYQMFMVSSCRRDMEEHFRTYDNTIIVINTAGIGWIAASPGDDQKQNRIYHLLGPFFTVETNDAYLYRICSKLKISSSLMKDVVRELKEIPGISPGTAQKYAVMLHYALTAQAAAPQQISVYNEKIEDLNPQQAETSYHGTWEAEQKFFAAVRDGADIHVDTVLADFSHGEIGVSADDPLRQMKNELIVKAVICSRAVIIGGVSPDGSYSLADYYMRQVEESNSISQMTNLAEEMLQAFLYRSRQAKKGGAYSVPIRVAMEYINDHIYEKISLKDMAQTVHYTEYYLSSKFKKEVGKSINTYIMECKMEAAERMLSTGRYTVSDVSDLLGFSTASYFGTVFKQYTGMTPREFMAGAGDQEPNS